MERRPADLSSRPRRLAPVSLILVVLALVFSGAASALPRSNQSLSVSGLPILSMSPNPLELGLGLTHNVDVMVEGIEGLYAYELRIAFPNSLVQVVDADPAVEGVQVQAGDIYHGFDTFTLQNTANNATGVIEYIISLTGTGRVGVDGGGKLITIPLQGVGVGNGVLSFVEVLLAEPDGTSIEYQIDASQLVVDVVSETSTPTLPPGVTPSATSTSTETATLTPTSTETPTSTATSTQTPKVSDTPTSTPLLTDTPTVTPSTTATPSPTETPTSTLTPTETPSPTATADIAQVLVVPDQMEMQIGDDDIIQIQVTNICDLYLFDLRVDYNGAILDVEDADAQQPGIQVFMGDVFDSFPYQVQQNEVQDDAIFGQVHFLASLASGLPSGFCGDGVMIWMVFRGVAPGVSNVTLSEVALANHSGGAIPRALWHGQIEVLAGPTAVPSPTPTSTVVPTETHTPAATSTPTASPTATATQTEAATLTPTPTYTDGPSPTYTSGPSPTSTSTATMTVDAPTPTSTATPTSTTTGALVTATPVCSDLIENGGFETRQGSEAQPWVRGGATTYTTIEQHAGSYSAWLGGYNNANDTLYQRVSIPAHPQPGEQLTEATLRYWWGVVTQETDHVHDSMWVRLRNEAGDLLQELETISDGSTTGEWVQSEFDVSSFEGQTLRVSFEAETDGANLSSFYVDDVELIICEILLPVPTATATSTPTISPTPTETPAATLTPTITPTPVVIELQRDELGYQNCYDAYLNEWEPTTNFGHTGALPIRTGGVKRPVLYFDVSQVPAGVTVMDARLWLRTSHYKSHPQTPTIEIFGLKRTWVEMETTWEIAQSGMPWTSGGADSISFDRDATPASVGTVVDINTWYDFDVTSLARAWVDGSRSNDGLMLLASGNTVETSFWSAEYSVKELRPKLVIAYTTGSSSTPVPTNTPAPTSEVPTATPTAAPAGTELILQTDNLGYSGVEDTYISNWEPTSNYGSNVTMLVRQGDVRSALLRFDLTALPTNATIHQATLGLSPVSRSFDGSINLNAHAVLRPWAEGQATWQDATVGNPWGAAGCNLAGTDLNGDPEDTYFVDAAVPLATWHELDLTALTQSWVASPASNYGVIIKGSGTAAVEYVYAASGYYWATDLSPRLVLRYSTP